MILRFKIFFYGRRTALRSDHTCVYRNRSTRTPVVIVLPPFRGSVLLCAGSRLADLQRRVARVCVLRHGVRPRVEMRRGRSGCTLVLRAATTLQALLDAAVGALAGATRFADGSEPDRARLLCGVRTRHVAHLPWQLRVL